MNTEQVKQATRELVLGLLVKAFTGEKGLLNLSFITVKSERSTLEKVAINGFVGGQKLSVGETMAAHTAITQKLVKQTAAMTKGNVKESEIWDMYIDMCKGMANKDREEGD